MLVLSRKKDECIVINNDITIVVVEIRGDKVRLGVEAPKEVPVHRREVFDAIARGVVDLRDASVDFIDQSRVDEPAGPVTPQGGHPQGGQLSDAITSDAITSTSDGTGGPEGIGEMAVQPAQVHGAAQPHAPGELHGHSRHGQLESRAELESPVDG